MKIKLPLQVPSGVVAAPTQLILVFAERDLDRIRDFFDLVVGLIKPNVVSAVDGQAGVFGEFISRRFVFGI